MAELELILIAKIVLIIIQWGHLRIVKLVFVSLCESSDLLVVLTPLPPSLSNNKRKKQKEGPKGQRRKEDWLDRRRKSQDSRGHRKKRTLKTRGQKRRPISGRKD